MGGITIEIEKEEIEHINDYIDAMAKSSGVKTNL